MTEADDSTTFSMLSADGSVSSPGSEEEASSVSNLLAETDENEKGCGRSVSSLIAIVLAVAGIVAFAVGVGGAVQSRRKSENERLPGLTKPLNDPATRARASFPAPRKGGLAAREWTVVDKGKDGCTTSSPCGQCQGDCDTDAHCAGHLKCFQRSSSIQVVPGCATTGYVRSSSDHDYCYEAPCGCDAYWLGDGYCDDSCNVVNCNYDNGDCQAACSTYPTSQACPRRCMWSGTACQARPTIGDSVMVLPGQVPSSNGNCERYEGQTGKIVTDDQSDQPYQIDGFTRSDGKGLCWFRETSIRKQAALPQYDIRTSGTCTTPLTASECELAALDIDAPGGNANPTGCSAADCAPDGCYQYFSSNSNSLKVYYSTGKSGQCSTARKCLCKVSTPSSTILEARGTWVMVAAGKYCGIRKALQNNGSSIEHCQTLARADPECGDVMYGNGDMCRCVPVGKKCDFRISTTNNVYQWQTTTSTPTPAPQAGKWILIAAGKYCSSSVRKSLQKSGASIEQCQALAKADPSCSGVIYGNGDMCQCVVDGMTCDFLSSSSNNNVYQWQTSTSRPTPAPQAGSWILVAAGKYCSSSVRKDLQATGASIEKCQALAKADPECGDVMYGNGDMCRCVLVGEKCDFLASTSNNVYQWQTSASTPTPAPQAGKWTLVAAGKYCSSSVRKNLQATGASVEKCQALAKADPECGNIMYGNGDMCRCVLVGKECDFLSSTSNNVYQWQALSVAKCAALEFDDGKFVANGCDGLRAGESCEVACPAGQLGEPARFWCFAALAITGAAPAGTHLPTCTGATLEKVDQRPFMPPRPAISNLKPAIAAAIRGDGRSLMKNAMAVQQCRAKLESNVPDSFWRWLKKQDKNFKRSLFSSFPVHPGQINLLHEIVQFVGEKKINEAGLGAWAIGLSYFNRWKTIDEVVTAFQWQNGASFLEHEAEDFKKEMMRGRHTYVQSNVCRSYKQCCKGTYETWKFKWPRDPAPSIRQWIGWWLEKVAKLGDKLWTNPVRDLPWYFVGFHVPSPLAECEWVHDKIIHNRKVRWYRYDKNFHLNFCPGGEYHPDSIMGITTYGGVCGRMAMGETRKNSCMGVPAQTKSEPGHCAGFKFLAQSRYANTTKAVQFKNFHHIKCTKSNCHFSSLIGNLDPTSRRRTTKRQHVEAAMSLAEAFNSYESQGIWPTAYDEARLAASMTHSLKQSGATTTELKPIITWALERNPALYEAWDIAVRLHVEYDDALRGTVEAHQYYKSLAGRRLQEKLNDSAAEDFAQKYLLSSVLQQHWRRFPVLHDTVTQHLCPHLSEATLRRLLTNAAERCLRGRGSFKEEEAEGEASEEVAEIIRKDVGRKLYTLNIPRWVMDLANELKYADDLQDGNVPSGKFLDILDDKVKPHLSSAPLEIQRVFVRLLLNKLTVGFVDERSPSYFAEHKRLLLRGPYVEALKLAAGILDCNERQVILEHVVLELTKPNEFTEDMAANSSKIKNSFVESIYGKTGGGRGTSPRPLGRRLRQAEEEVLFDFTPQEFMQQVMEDRSMLIELSDLQYEDAMRIPLELRFNATWLLRRHLRLQSCNPPKARRLRSFRKFFMQRSRRLQIAQSRPSAEELMDMCIADTLEETD